MRRSLPVSPCLLVFFLLAACTSPTLTPAPVEKTLYVFRLSPPALLRLSDDLTTIENEIPVSFPGECNLSNLYPSPNGTRLAAELSCPAGPVVMLVDPKSGTTDSLIRDAGVDSHYLAWSPDERSVYLRADTLGDPHIERVDVTNFQSQQIPITEFTYDLAAAPDGKAFTFTFSRGLGFGSEIWLAKEDGNVVRQLLADANSYLSFARWSPDGKQIAFIKIPDSQVPFTVGELWVVNADGSHPRKLADADSGHGYAAAWSPDGSRLAFIVRSNPADAQADQVADALVSNIAIVEVSSGTVTPVTRFTGGYAQTPAWSADGHILAFTSVIDGRMEVQVADLARDAVSAPITEPACCPAWMRK